MSLRPRRLGLTLFLAALAAGCAFDPPPRLGAAAPVSDRVAAAHVVRDRGGWSVEFRFARASPVWAFRRSALPRKSERSWREESWTVATPGVRLERRGRYDVLTAVDGGMVPLVVRIRFTPFSGDLLSSYDPALVFTDGSVALFDGQFEVFPVASPAAADALPQDTGDIREARVSTRVEFRNVGGRVLYGGRRQRRVVLEGAGTYVLFGPAQPVVTNAMAAIIDPALRPGCAAF